MMRQKSGQTAEELVKGLVTEWKISIISYGGVKVLIKCTKTTINVLFDVVCEAGIRISHQMSSTCFHIKTSTVFLNQQFAF